MKLKRIFGACQIVLALAVVLLFFTTCINIDPVKQVALPNHKYNGFTAFLGASADFKASVGGIMTVVFVGLAVVMAALKVGLPKLSIIWNCLIVVLAVCITVFLFMGGTEFMVNASNNAIKSYEFYCDVKLGVGTILGGICSIAVVGLSIAEEIVSFKNR